MRNILKFVFSIFISSVLTACGGSDDSEQKYVGKVMGTDAYIGVVESGKRVIAYVCDGNNISQWFEGSFTQAGVVKLESNGQTLMLQATPQGFQGTYEKDGDRKSFLANSIPSASEAGIYRADVPINDQSIIGGWVVLEDQTRRGLVTLGGTKLSTSGFSLSTSSVQITANNTTSLITVSPVSTTTVTCRFSGVVSNSSGALISGLRVRIFDTSTLPERLIGEATTDSRGSYSLSVNQSSTSITKTYRIIVLNSAGQTIAQTTSSTSCGATTNFSIP